jgi:hypothetical protein
MQIRRPAPRVSDVHQLVHGKQSWIRSRVGPRNSPADPVDRVPGVALLAPRRNEEDERLATERSSERNYLRLLVGQQRFVFVALDVIVIGTVIAIVHVHGNDTVGVIGSH